MFESVRESEIEALPRTAGEGEGKTVKPQVDWLQVMDALLDRKAVRVDQLFDGTFNRLFPMNVLTQARLDEIVAGYGAKYTHVDGVKYIVKNNAQREVLVRNSRAMDWFMRTVVRSGMVWNREMIKSASDADGINWRSVCRAACSMGWYLIPDAYGPGQDGLKPYGYEMDRDLRIRVCRLMASAWKSGGVDLDSDLMWQMVVSREPWGISDRDYDICIALVKSGFYGNGVEL